VHVNQRTRSLNIYYLSISVYNDLKQMKYFLQNNSPYYRPPGGGRLYLWLCCSWWWE